MSFAIETNDDCEECEKITRAKICFGFFRSKNYKFTLESVCAIVMLQMRCYFSYDFICFAMLKGT